MGSDLRPRIAIFAFILPFCLLALLVSGAGHLVLRLRETQRQADRALGEWWHLHLVSTRTFTFHAPGESADATAAARLWREELQRCEAALAQLRRDAPAVLLGDSNRQRLDNAWAVWELTRTDLDECARLFEQLQGTELGRQLAGLPYARLVQTLAAGNARPSLPPQDLWLFYRLQDRLTNLDVSGRALSELLPRTAAAINRTSARLQTGIEVVALLLACLIVALAFAFANRAEASLRESRENLRITLESIGDAVIATDARGHVARMNAVAEKLTGWPSAAAHGRDLAEIFRIVNAYTRQTVENPVHRVLREGCTVGLANHTALIARDGSERQIADSGAPIRDRRGTLVGVVLVFRDVTELEEQDRRLRESEERFRQLADATWEAILVHDKGQLLQANDEALRMFGYAREEMLGGQLLALIVAPEARSFCPNLFDASQAGPVEVRGWRRDGSRLPLELRSRRMRWQGRDVQVAAVRDMTESRRQERELRTLFEYLRQAQEIAHLGYWTWDLAEGRGWWSEEMFRLHNLAPASQPPSRELLRACVHPDDRGAVERLLGTLSAGLPPFELDYRLAVAPEAAARFLHLRAAIEAGPDGRVQRLSGTVQDVSAQRLAEAERRQLENRALQAQKMESLGVLAGGIAHDFNNLLMAVLGHAELALAELPAAHPARPRVADIVTGARQAAQLTAQMLAYAGRARFVLREVDVSQLIGEMTSLLRTTLSKRATLTLDLAPELPRVYADVAQLQQVVMNLITNASDALGEHDGDIAIRTRVRVCDAAILAQNLLPASEMLDSPQPGRYVCIEVGDSGCGMDAATQKRIFEPFFTTKFAGRGLGLAAVMGIVRAHRGALFLESAPGRGSLFRILFPALAATPSAPAAPPPPQPPPRWQGSGTVLLVDDEGYVRQVARLMLERLGFTVRTAADGQEALDLFAQAPDDYACVVLDMTMPRLSGEECLRELRRRAPGVRVLISSGYSEHEVADRLGGGPALGFIQKPYHLEILAEKLRQLLEGRSA